MKNPLRILIVEDSMDDALFMLRELERGGLVPECERVDTLSALGSALDRERWDLVISDHSLPGFCSLHALALVRERDADIPFIVVSGTIGEEAAVNSMKAGANEYVMKNQLARLKPAVERELREAASRRAQREAEKALRRSERELHDFFEQATIGLHWLGPDGIILRVNQAELDLLGYARDEYAGHHFSEFYVDKQVANHALKRLHNGDSLSNFEVRLRCRNGDIRHVLINSSVLREDGKFIHSRGFTRDITEHKREEEERLRLIGELTDALSKIKTLRGFLPICAACKNIRDDHGYWKKIESFISDHTEAEFTHGICPECFPKLYSQYSLKA